MLDLLSGISSSLLETLPLIPAAIGFYVALRALKFPDLTVEGSFVFGAVISAYFIQNGYSPYLAIIFAIIGGIFCGLLTSLWNVWFKIPPFTSGIITTFAITSLNYGILKQLSAQKEQIASLPLNNSGIFRHFKAVDFSNNTFWGQLRISQIGALIIVIIIITIATYLILNSNWGLFLRAFGSDKKAGNIYNKKYYLATIYGLSFSNGLVAISGSIVTQFEASVNISKGATLLIPLLAAVVFGEFIVDFLYANKFKKNKVTKPILSRPLGLAFAPSIGFILYNMIVLLFGAILIPSTSFDNYHKYWIVALSMVVILAYKKLDVSEKHTNDLI